MQASLLWQGADPAGIGELCRSLLPQLGWCFLEPPFWFVVHLFLSPLLLVLFKKDTNENVPNCPASRTQLVQHPVSQWVSAQL